MNHLTKKTKRLIVRPFVLSDYEAWVKTREESQIAVNRWDTADQLKSISKTDYKKNLTIWNKRIKEESFYHLGVFKKDGSYIGFINIMDIQRGIFHNAYLGYKIYSKYWKQGYGKEAVQAAITIAFKGLNLHRLEAAIEPKTEHRLLLQNQ